MSFPDNTGLWTGKLTGLWLCAQTSTSSLPKSHYGLVNTQEVPLLAKSYWQLMTAGTGTGSFFFPDVTLDMQPCSTKSLHLCHLSSIKLTSVFKIAHEIEKEKWWMVLKRRGWSLAYSKHSYVEIILHIHSYNAHFL